MAKRKREFGSIRALPSGRFQARFTGPDGAMHKAPITFDALIDARGWLDRQRRDIADGLWEPAGKATAPNTLAAYAADWLETRTTRHGALKPRTRAEYERLLDGPLAPLAAKRLEAITPAAVRSWHAAQIKAGTKTQAARAYGFLKAVMNTAVSDGVISSNPCQVRGAGSISTGRKVIPPTSAELAKIVDAIDPRWKAAVIIAAWAGCRYGELTALRRKDVVIVRDGRTVENIVINITRAVSRVPGKGFVVGSTKSEAGVRSVALPPHVFPYVLEHLKEHTGDSPDALLFPAADGTDFLAPSAFYGRETTYKRNGHVAVKGWGWYGARQAADREDMPFHALRHFGLTRYAQTGATLKEIQERAGHSTVAAAMRYQHAAGRDAELARRMSELE
jgi:integrase